MYWGYLVPVVLLLLQLEHLMVDLVLLVLQVLQLECLGVDLVLVVAQLVSLLVDLRDDVGNLLLNLLSLSLLLQQLYPTFFLVPLPVPLPLPFTHDFCTDFALCLTALDATGLCVSKCTDLDLVLGQPALDVDAVGLPAIRHSTVCQNFVFVTTPKILKIDH